MPTTAIAPSTAVGCRRTMPTVIQTAHRATTATTMTAAHLGRPVVVPTEFARLRSTNFTSSTGPPSAAGTVAAAGALGVTRYQSRKIAVGMPPTTSGRTRLRDLATASRVTIATATTPMPEDISEMTSSAAAQPSRRVSRSPRSTTRAAAQPAARLPTKPI